MEGPIAGVGSGFWADELLATPGGHRALRVAPADLVAFHGTAGVKAVEELIALGINVNITLLFGRGMYESVAGAYIEGLEDHVGRDDGNTAVSGIARIVGCMDSSELLGSESGETLALVAQRPEAPVSR